MDLITKRYSQLFSRSYEWINPIFLEVILTFGLIGFLVILALRVGFEHIYKASHAQLLPNYTVTARFDQHQALAWNGNFDQVKGSIEFDGSDSTPDQSMAWEANKTHIKIGSYKFISDHYLMLELKEHQGASLIPECSGSSLPLNLLPYHCKLKKHD